jgi:hypothetical protein
VERSDKKGRAEIAAFLLLETLFILSLRPTPLCSAGAYGFLPRLLQAARRTTGLAGLPLG